jgi:hypothetical protein
MKLTAYSVCPTTMPIHPASHSRTWMDRTPSQFAKRCLPLKLANQAGWFILNDCPVRLTWKEDSKHGVTVESLEEGARPSAKSHFGSGIITWILPYLFRTSPGYNLLARGPANHPKDGITALEGLIETDWLCLTFTMNWQLTRRHLPVVFERDEPICMLVPQRRGELESFDCSRAELTSNPRLYESYSKHRQARSQFLADLADPASEASSQRWQKHYMKGQSVEGEKAEQHQTKLALKPFVTQ